MTLLVEITDTTVYDGDNGGPNEPRPYKFQKVWIHVPLEPHPSKNKRVITKDTPALPAGWYRFEEARAYSNWSWSRVELSTRNLVQLTEQERASLQKKAA